MTVLLSVTKTDAGYVCDSGSPVEVDECKLPGLLGLNLEQAHTVLARAGAKLLWNKPGGDAVEGLYALPIK